MTVSAAAARQRKHRQKRAEMGETTVALSVSAATKAAFKRLAGFYGATDKELFARMVADLEKATIATLSETERESYFTGDM